MENILFDLQNLSVEFRTDEETVYAVNNVSIKLAAFKTLGIVGETGAGKTTTAKALLRLTPKHSVLTCNK